MSRPADRVSLLDRVTAILDRADVPYAVIGAATMTAHGVARSTHDIDLLALAGSCLDRALWAPLADAGVSVSVTRGDAADPLAGVVRFEESGQRPVDLVVGRHGWQARVLERAQPALVHGSRVPAAQARDLIALKLFAGGAQDARTWRSCWRGRTARPSSPRFPPTSTICRRIAAVSGNGF